MIVKNSQTDIRLPLEDSKNNHMSANNYHDTRNNEVNLMHEDVTHTCVESAGMANLFSDDPHGAQMTPVGLEKITIPIDNRKSIPAEKPELGHYEMGVRTIDENGNACIKSSILWDDSYSFEDRLNCFRNSDSRDQAIKFKDLSPEDRQTIFSHLTKAEQTALFDELSNDLKTEVTHLLSVPENGDIPDLNPPTASVYMNNLLNGELAQVNLFNLWGDGTLRGGGILVVWEDETDENGYPIPVVKTDDNIFIFKPGSAEFNAVNAYYYAQSTRNFFSDMGAQNLNVEFKFYSDGYGTLLVDGEVLGDIQQNDAGLAIQPIAHEYTHALISKISGRENWSSHKSWSVASEIVEESICTVLPALMTNEPKFNQWTRRNEPEKIIDLSNNDFTYDPNATERNTQAHNRSGVGSGINSLSSALWDMSEGMEKGMAAKIIFDAIDDIDFSAGEGFATRAESDMEMFTSFANALIKADEELTGGVNRELISQVFENRGLSVKP